MPGASSSRGSLQSSRLPTAGVRALAAGSMLPASSWAVVRGSISAVGSLSSSRTMQLGRGKGTRCGMGASSGSREAVSGSVAAPVDAGALQLE